MSIKENKKVGKGVRLEKKKSHYKKMRDLVKANPLKGLSRPKDDII